MKSVGIDFKPLLQQDLLLIHSARSSQVGLDMHLLTMEREVERYDPQVVVIDPITSLVNIASPFELKRMLMKLIDFFKVKGITVMIGSLVTGGESQDGTSIAISSLIDTWILLRDMEANGERTRAVFIRKSRGMAHSNKVREFVITDHGVDVLDAFTGPEGVLVGDARILGRAKQEAVNLVAQQSVARDLAETNLKIKQLHARIADIGEELIQLETRKFNEHPSLGAMLPLKASP